MVKMAFSGMQETPESEKSSTVSGPNPTISLLLPRLRLKFESSSLQITNHKLNGKASFNGLIQFNWWFEAKENLGILMSISPSSATDSTYKFDGIKNWRNLSRLSHCYEYLGCCDFGVL